MAQVSPPKPWERAGRGAVGGSNSAALTALPSAGTGSLANNSTLATSASAINSNPSDPPALPDRPSSLNSVVNRTASNYTNPNNRGAYGSSPYGMNSYGSSPYGGMGGMGGMYGGSRFGGGMGSSMYGGGMYGGGGMMGGMGGMYGGGMMNGGMGGMPGDPNDPNNMTNNFQQSTQATFQLIESIVGAFGGFAQMLESTYMATHSSFFAMVSVAEQFGNLRQTLGSVLGIYTLLRWLRTLIAKVTGRPPPADATALTPSAFAAFTSGQPHNVGPDGTPTPRPSKKPFIVFLLAVFGLPYLMGKLIKTLAQNQETAQQNPQHLPPPLDPSKLDFCRLRFDFPPPEALANGSFTAGIDLEVKKGDLVAVLDKSAPDAGPGAPDAEWWRCRARDGRMGYLPAVYLETIPRRATAQITDASRANSMPGNANAGSAGAGAKVEGRAATMSGATQAGSRASSMNDAAKKTQLEGFQKGWVNER